MGFPATDVINRVRFTLLDVNASGWTDAELLSHLNAGMTQLVSMKPDALTKTHNIALDPGIFQQLPDDAVVLLETIMNGAKDTVRMVTLAEFTAVHPNWPGEDTGAVQFVIYDPRSPREFMVYPQAESGRSVWLKYGAMPDRITGLGQNIDLDVKFETPLWAFVLASAYAKNSTRQNLGKSAQFMTMFTQFTVGSSQAERLTAGSAAQGAQ